MTLSNKASKKTSKKQEVPAVVQAENKSQPDSLMTDSTTKPHTDLPDAVQTKAQLEPAPELVIVYIPAKRQYLMVRGQENMRISPQEMAGIFALGAQASLGSVQ